MRLTFSPSSSSKVGFVFNMILNVLFVGVGGYACYWGYRMYYVEGQSWQSAAVFAGVGGIFLLSSLVGIVYAFRQRAKRRQQERLQQTHSDAPWMVRPAWRDGRISTSEQRSGKAWFLILFALVWNAFSWPLAYYVLSGRVQGDGNPWLVLAFPLVGLALAAYLVYQGVRRRKFGDTVLELETMPGRLGGRLTGVVQTRVKAGAAPEEGFHVSLSCYRRRVRYTTDGDGDRTKKIDLDLLWRDEKRLRGRPYAARDGTQRLEVPVSFALPEEEPTSTPFKRENRILWRLDLRAAMPGIDYGAELEVPVFAPDGREVSASGDTEPQQEGGSEKTTEGEAVYWDLSGDGAGGPVHHAAKENQETEPDPYENYEVGKALSAPVSDGIEVRPSAGGGTEFFFDKARDKTTLLVFGGVALAMGAGTVLLFMNGILAVGLFVGLFALLFGYVAYRQATFTSTLTVEQGQISVRRGPHGGGKTETFPASELEKVLVDVGGQAGGNARYTIELRRAQRAEEHAKHAAGAERAASFAGKFASVAEVATTGRTGGPRAEDASDKVQQKMDRQARTVQVAGGLTDKQEADWLAAQIEEAARQEARFG